eukprot:scaffold5160_cov152-Cylindrotheca_fusiformis.AAC.2
MSNKAAPNYNSFFDTCVPKAPKANFFASASTGPNFALVSRRLFSSNPANHCHTSRSHGYPQSEVF